jgi:hypothetical protein
MINKTFIARHGVLTYYALVFTISWGGIVAVIGPAGILDAKYDPRALAQFVYVAALAGPSVAGVLVTGLVAGLAGFREILSRLCKWRVGVRWYAVALLTAPLLTTAILFVLSLTFHQFLATTLTTKDKSGVVLTGSAVWIKSSLSLCLKCASEAPRTKHERGFGIEPAIACGGAAMFGELFGAFHSRVGGPVSVVAIAVAINIKTPDSISN